MNCILCGNKKLRILTKRLRDNEPGIVWYCPECDFGMLEDDRSSVGLRHYYCDDIYRQEHRYPPTDAHLKYQEKRVDLLKPYLNENTRLLDIGCSKGYFIMTAKDYVKEAIGIDYDKKAVSHAERWTGCKILWGELEESGLDKESFDVIVATHILEHTYDPIHFLGATKKYIKPSGIIYVEVPNINDAINTVYKSKGFKDVLFHRAHKWYFTPKSLAITMEKANFSGMPVSLNMYNVLNHISWVLTDTPMDMGQAIREPVLPVGDDVPEEIKNDLQEWITDTNIAYKDILLKHGISGEIGFIGYLN